MLRKVLYVLLSLVIISSVFAEERIAEALVPKDPDFMAFGGAGDALSSGLMAFGLNPAGFAAPESQFMFTLPSISTWVYARPDKLGPVIDTILSGGDPTNSAFISALTDQFSSNGIGAGASARVALLINGLALGVIATADSRFFGDSVPLGLTGSMTAQLDFVGGYALGLDLFGGRLLLGGDIRPFVRVESLFTSSSTADLLKVFGLVPGGDSGANIAAAVTALNGAGVAIDVGAIYRHSGFAVSASIRDLFGTRITYSSNTLDQVLSTIGSLALPATAATSEWVIPATMRFGVAWKPDLGGLGFLFSPQIAADIVDPFGLNDTGIIKPSLWTKLHVGVGVKLLSFLTLSGGLNQGYLTAGASLRLFFLDLSAAVFTSEHGLVTGDRPVTGMSIDVRILFQAEEDKDGSDEQD